MEFDKTRVYTALNADELKVGSKVYVSDNIYYLKKCVEDNLESCILTEVLLEKEANRFCIDDMINEQWQLAYLIEPPDEPKHKPFSNMENAVEVVKKHGGWIKRKTNNSLLFITGFTSSGIFLGNNYHYDFISLFREFIFADDNSPCGELVEE